MSQENVELVRVLFEAGTLEDTKLDLYYDRENALADLGLASKADRSRS